MNVHLSAHVSYLLSYMSEHVLVWFGGHHGAFPLGFTLAPFSLLKHTPNTHLISNIGGLG
jgi:hypothetical protein